MPSRIYADAQASVSICSSYMRYNQACMNCLNHQNKANFSYNIKYNACFENTHKLVPHDFRSIVNHKAEQEVYNFGKLMVYIYSTRGAADSNLCYQINNTYSEILIGTAVTGYC